MVKPSRFPLIVLEAVMYGFDFNPGYITGFIFINFTSRIPHLLALFQGNYHRLLLTAPWNKHI